MRKSDVVAAILSKRTLSPVKNAGQAFAPTNIALCKYWGKRDAEINLPLTASLSIALPSKGSRTLLLPDKEEKVKLNGKYLEKDTPFVKRLYAFLDLFRAPTTNLSVELEVNIPIAAGLASSACGFASLVLALNDLYNWQLTKKELSIFARLGSGSAARSLWNGFVEWQCGVEADGMDSFAEPLPTAWPELQVGILSLTTKEKPISSRLAMQRTIETSVLYEKWPQVVARDLLFIKKAILEKDFSLLGRTAEANALAMHATMLSSWPPICYSLPDTLKAMQQVWRLREEGVEVYFTQDAGPNLKLLFLKESVEAVKQVFASLEVVEVFFPSPCPLPQ